MSTGSKLKAIDAKVDRQYLDLVKRFDSFSELLNEVRDDSLSSIEERIRSLDYEPDESRAEKLARDIKDDLKAVSKIVFTMQKHANELIEQSESLERFANGTYTYKYRDADSRLYQVMEDRKRRRENR
jgi:DNA-binding ferritin-like protein